MICLLRSTQLGSLVKDHDDQRNLVNNRIYNFLYIIFFSNTCSNIAIVILIFKMHTLSCFFSKQINFRVQTFCEISPFRLLAACFLSTLPSNLLKCSLTQRNSPPPPTPPRDLRLRPRFVPLVVASYLPVKKTWLRACHLYIRTKY